MALKEQFATAGATLTGPEETLRALGVAYQKQPDGTLVVPGSIDLEGKGLTALPDLSAVIVRGYFSCSRNQLTSLLGAPQVVEGNFFCSSNRLSSLEHGPCSVGNFLGADNQLTSLAGAPDTEGSFDCRLNPLKYLEGAPPSFARLKSDLGEYPYWEDIPEPLRVSPETLARRERERAQADAQKIRNATVLDHDLPIQKPFRFQKPDL